MIAALVLLATSAHAGGYIAGGLMGSPTPAASVAVGAPALRVGWGSEAFVGFASAQYARVHLDDPELNLFGLQPTIGVRGRLVGEDGAKVTGVGTAALYTRVWGISGEDVEDTEPDTGKIRPVGGLVLGGGLDARLSPNLSLSAELGLDLFTAGYVYDGWVSHGDSVSTWSAVYLNFWL